MYIILFSFFFINDTLNSARLGKPNIFKIVKIFKNEEANSDQRFRRATKNPPSKPRENYYVDKDSKVQTYKE